MFVFSPSGCVSLFCTPPAHTLAHKTLFLPPVTFQAGEYGAVRIYDGASFALTTLAPLLGLIHPRLAADSPHLARAREFVAAHAASERQHLEIINRCVPPSERTWLLPMWHVAGFSLGALPLIVGGDRALFATVDHVESFVEGHYQEQIVWLRSECESARHGTHASWLGPSLPRALELLELLELACADEVHHRDESRQLVAGSTQDSESAHETRSVFAALWRKIIEIGSRSAVSASKAL